VQQAAKFAPVGVFLAAFLLYVPSFDALFAVLDFNHLDAIRTTDASTFFLRIFDPSDGGRTIIGTGDLYRPIYYTVFWFEYQAFGADPLPYYVFNAALHATNAVLVYVLARRLTNSTLASFAGALIWAFHPQYADAVAWISSTTDRLLVFFGLIAVLCYAKGLELQGRNRAMVLAASFCATLFALGAKESGMVLVPILVGYHLLLGDRDLVRDRRVPWEALPFIAIPLVYFPMRAALVGNLASEGGNEIFSLDVFGNIHVLASLTAAPLIGETVSTSAFGVAQGIAGAVVLAAIVLAVIVGSRREWFLAGWFFVAMTPVLIFPQVWLIGRYLYLPMVGLAILAGLGVKHAANIISAWSADRMRAGAVGALQSGAGIALIVGVVVWLGPLTIDHQNLITSKGEEAGAFILELQEAYPELPAEGRLIVTQHPRSLSFVPNDGMMLTSAVRIAYNSDVEVITPWHFGRGSAAPTELDYWYPPEAVTQN
jgi:hypothetical protein